MSSFPKHSFEQAYDHAFPPSPDELAPPLTISERSPLISKAPLTEGASSSDGINISSRNTLQPGNSYTSNDSSTSYVTAKSSALAETDPLLEHGLNYGDGIHPHSQQQPRRRRGDSVSIRSSSAFLTVRELTVREFRILLKYSGPVVLTYILQNSLQMASLVSLGHLGSIGKKDKRYSL
jgi:MATE family multidrug resistance protein